MLTESFGEGGACRSALRHAAEQNRSKFAAAVNPTINNYYQLFTPQQSVQTDRWTDGVDGYYPARAYPRARQNRLSAFNEDAGSVRDAAAKRFI